MNHIERKIKQMKERQRQAHTNTTCKAQEDKKSEIEITRKGNKRKAR